jgi:hypothetical protein
MVRDFFEDYISLLKTNNSEKGSCKGRRRQRRFLDAFHNALLLRLLKTDNRGNGNNRSKLLKHNGRSKSAAANKREEHRRVTADVAQKIAVVKHFAARFHFALIHTYKKSTTT